MAAENLHFTDPDDQQPIVTPRSDQYQSLPSNRPQVSQPQVAQDQTIVAVTEQTGLVSGVVIIQQKPNDYLIYSLLNTFLCCFFLGIAALIYSSKVDSEYAAGNIQKAIIASQKAKKLNIFGVVIGTTVNLMVAICVYVTVIIATSEKYDN